MNTDFIRTNYKKLISLVLCAALAVMPTVDVTAKTITLRGLNNIDDITKEIIYPYDTFSWNTTGIESPKGELIVKYIYDGAEEYVFDSGEFDVANYTTNPYEHQITRSHEDLDHWRIGLDYTRGDSSNPTKVFLTLTSELKIYTIKFDPQGGKCEKASMTTARNGKLTELPTPTWDSRHVFRGWFDAPEGGTKIDTNYVFNRDTTIYAQWKVGKTTPTPRPTATPTPSPEEGRAAVENERTGYEVYNPSAIGGFCYTNGILQTNTKIGRQEQSPLAEMVFAAAIPPGWNTGFSMSMTVNGMNDYSLKKGELLLYIPGAYQKPGRQFALLAMDKNGKVFVLNDIDNQPNSLTVNLNIEGYAFHLIYKD